MLAFQQTSKHLIYTKNPVNFKSNPKNKLMYSDVEAQKRKTIIVNDFCSEVRLFLWNTWLNLPTIYSTFVSQPFQWMKLLDK
jgi:hypothetical protein